MAANTQAGLPRPSKYFVEQARQLDRAPSLTTVEDLIMSNRDSTRCLNLIHSALYCSCIASPIVWAAHIASVPLDVQLG